jgi:hypothetical protein
MAFSRTAKANYCALFGERAHRLHGCLGSNPKEAPAEGGLTQYTRAVRNPPGVRETARSTCQPGRTGYETRSATKVKAGSRSGCALHGSQQGRQAFGNLIGGGLFSRALVSI